MASNTTLNAKNVNSNVLNSIGGSSIITSLSVSGGNGLIGTTADDLTNLPDTGTLTANKLYRVFSLGTNKNVNLPENPVKGDTVRFIWVGDNGTHNIIINSSGTADTAPFYSTTSFVFIAKVGNATGGCPFTVVTPPNGTQEIFTITNSGTNQCSGVGSQLVATYTGTRWDLHGKIMAGGNATAVPTGAFSS